MCLSPLPLMIFFFTYAVLCLFLFIVLINNETCLVFLPCPLVISTDTLTIHFPNFDVVHKECKPCQINILLSLQNTNININ